MADACRARDFGAIFKLAQRAGLYPSRIARLCDMTPSRVSEVIANKRAVTQIGVIERIADGIGIPGAMLGLAARPWEADQGDAPATAPSSTLGRPPVIGRQSPAPAFEPILPMDDEALELKRELARASAADGAVARLYAMQIDTMRQMDRQMGAATVLPQLEAQIAQMEDLLEYRTAPGGREPMAAALTEAATLAGWQALDLGQYQKAWRLHETAKSAARQSGSAALLAHAMGQQAYVLLDLGEADQAVEQLRYARESAGGGLPPLMETWLFAAEAEAHAVAGHEALCRAGMDRAEAVRPADPRTRRCRSCSWAARTWTGGVGMRWRRWERTRRWRT
ncbi:hypothetical protein O1L60_44495 [Streptomyces diastatochromogenes]|nr:hypothetical protein [Streptomyces diastatochromogenes]